MSLKIRKAVFPVAGLGTRTIPATKAIAKEMLPIVDKPIIQYAVEEALLTGITELIFITSRTKNSIQDHFDKAYELELELEKKGQTASLSVVQTIIPATVTCSYVRQAEALGLGHAVLCAKTLIGDEPFAVILPDDLIENGERGCIQQMLQRFEQQQVSIIAVENVPRENTNRYGIVSITNSSGNTHEIDSIVEKPTAESAPSTLAVVGRYLLTAKIFEMLEKTQKGNSGEIQLTDAIAKLLEHEQVSATCRW